MPVRTAAKGFLACVARTMKPVLNGTAEIPQLWVFRKVVRERYKRIYSPLFFD